MDYSSLTEAQQQQHQQQQTDQQQAYDPAQAQAYAAYYAAYDQYYAASGYYHQPYYPNDYSSSSAAAAPGAYYTEAQPESAPTANDAAQIHHPGTHATVYAQATEQDGYPYQAPQRLNHAAVAALTQLSQLTGTIDAAERAMAGMHDRQPPPHYGHYSQMQYGASMNRPGAGGSTHRGGGRRGGGSLRGRGGFRGSHTGQFPPRRDVGGPPRGRGHGRLSRGRGRRPHQSAPDSQRRQSAIANTSEPSISAASHARSLLPVAWCDICRVDCNSLEILEQHKNGKRHKRTVQRVLEIQAQQKVISTELQPNVTAQPFIFVQGENLHKVSDDGEVSTNTTNRALPSSGNMQTVDETIEGSVATENNSSLVLIAEQDKETGNNDQIFEGQSHLVSDSANTEVPLTDAPQDETLPIEGLSKKRRMVGYDRNERWRGSRPKMMRIFRGGRYIKSFDRAPNRPFERPKDRPRERPRVCTVCSVTCDTMAVFECHLSGKKHLTRIKRFEGQSSVFGPISVFIPPNQPTAFPSKGPEPLYYGLQTHEALQQEAELQHLGMLQQEGHGLDPPQMENPAVEQCNQLEHFEEAEGAVPDSDLMQTSGHPEELHLAIDEQESVIPDPEARSFLNNPEERETNNLAPDETDSTSRTAFISVEDASLPDCQNSTETAVVTEHEATSDEPLANNGLQ